MNAPARDGTAAPDPTVLLVVAEQVTRPDIAPYVDVVSDAPLVATLPTMSAIVTERRDPRIGTIEWQLAGGMRVIVKPTDFRADEVLLTGYSPGGVSLAPDQGYLISALAATLVSLGGLGGFDAVALDKKLSGKAARVMPYFTVTQEGVAGSASPKDLATLFQLVYLTFTAPRADTTAFRGYIANARAALEHLWVEDSGGTAKADFTADTDVSRINENIIVMGIVWRWLKARGLDYAEEKRDYEIALKNFVLRNNSGVLDMGGDGIGSRRGDYFALEAV